jgi:hypothetical protein
MTASGGSGVGVGGRGGVLEIVTCGKMTNNKIRSTVRKPQMATRRRGRRFIPTLYP